MNWTESSYKHNPMVTSTHVWVRMSMCVCSSELIPGIILNCPPLLVLRQGLSPNPNRYLKKYSVSLAIWEKQMNCFEIPHHSIHSGCLKETMTTRVGKRTRKEKPALLIAGGRGSGTAAMAIRMLPQQTESSTPARSSCSTPDQMLRRVCQHATETSQILLCGRVVLYSQGESQPRTP